MDNMEFKQKKVELSSTFFCLPESLREEKTISATLSHAFAVVYLQSGRSDRGYSNSSSDFLGQFGYSFPLV